MPAVSGPHNAKYTVSDDGEPRRVTTPLVSVATTLGAALDAYGQAFDVLVRPCAAPLPGQTETRYFEIRSPGGLIEWVVDVHVFREAAEICPRQDLAFALQPADRVELGALAC